MKRPRPSKSESSRGRAVGPGLLIPAGSAGAVGANGCSPGSDGRGSSPVQAGPASDATDPRDSNSISRTIGNGAVSCVNGSSNGSNVRPIRDRMAGSAPYAESPTRNWGVRAGPSLTPCTEAPCVNDSASLSRRSLPKRVEPVTWAKYQPELFVRMAADGLSVDAAMVHLSGIAWLYAQERDDCRLPLRLSPLGVTPFHETPSKAVAELVAHGYWVRHPEGYEVVEHADVIRQSLSAQWTKREKDKRGQAAARARRKSSAESSDDSSPTQANNLTTNHAVREEVTPLPPIGECRTCHHREPLDGSGRCESCSVWDVSEAS